MIYSSIKKIHKYSNNITYEEFTLDDKSFDAIIRNMEIIGEAVKKIPSEVKERYKEIEWKKIASLRDILSHEYFSINKWIVWDVVVNKLPILNATHK